MTHETSPTPDGDLAEALNAYLKHFHLTVGSRARTAQLYAGSYLTPAEFEADLYERHLERLPPANGEIARVHEWNHLHLYHQDLARYFALPGATKLHYFLTDAKDHTKANDKETPRP